MKDEKKTKTQLIEEMAELRQQVAEWNTAEARYRHQEQRRTCKEKMRNALWQMSESQDIHQVLQVLYNELKILCPEIEACSVQMLNEEQGDGISYQISERRVHEIYAGPVAGTPVEACWREQRPVYRPNLKEEDPYNEAESIWDERGGYSSTIRSVLDVPFQQGTLAVNSTRSDPFSQEDIEILQEMAQVLSEGFQRQEDFLAMEQRNQELEEKDRLLMAFHRIAQETLSSLDPDQILDRLAQQIIEAGIFRSLTLSIVDTARNEYEVVRNYISQYEDGPMGPERKPIAVWHDDDDSVIGYRCSLDDPEDKAARACRRGELTVVKGWGNFLKEDPQAAIKAEGDPSPGYKAAYFIPVKQGDRVLAILATGSAPEEEEVMRHRIEVMQPLLDQVAIALEHARLYTNVQREITERKQVEEALQISQERYQLCTKAANVGVWDWNIRTNEFYLDPNLKAILGYSDEEIPNDIEVWVTYVHPEDRDPVMRAAQACIEGKTPEYTFEHRMIHKDGSVRWVFVRGMVIRDAHGDAIRMVGTDTDITERKHMEEEIRKAHNLESLGLLAGGIAHDFNNVLTGVIGNLDLLLRFIDKDREEYEIAMEAKTAADRTEDLTSQLLTFSRGGAPVKKTASVEELIRKSTHLSLSGANTKPEYHFPEDLWVVDMDVAQIGQVMQNLVLNADQAMPHGGIVKISATNVEVSDRDALPLAPGEYVKVSVEDQGIGMSAEIMSQVFDPYFTTKQAGHGLGLSITHSIISRHGGHITVRSEIDVGTTFEFYLPASSERAVVVPEAEEELPRGTGRILLMDDEETIHETVGRMLGELGYEVDSVYDGDEALQTYRASLGKGSPYDVVILDLTIPGGMGGRETVARLREMHPEARVIVASGYSNDPAMARYADYGFRGRLRKPVNLQDLAETVQRVLKGGE